MENRDLCGMENHDKILVTVFRKIPDCLKQTNTV